MAVVGAVKGLEQIEDAEEQRPMAPELDERIREARKGGLSAQGCGQVWGRSFDRAADQPPFRRGKRHRVARKRQEMARADSEMTRRLENESMARAESAWAGVAGRGGFEPSAILI
jgi:hypothetical protein